MFIGFGTILNITTILLGSALGLFLGKRFKESTRDLIVALLSFVTIIAAADSIRILWDSGYRTALPKGWAFLTVLFSLLLGSLIGVALKIEERMEVFGSYLKRKFDKNGNSPFIEGFVTSALIFVIGPMAILGSISDGMRTGTDQLVLKSLLDGIASIAFAAAFGWGVAASAIPVGIYQFSWTGIGFGLGAIMNDYQIAAMTGTGGVLLLMIALKIMKVKELPVGNVLPALFIAPLLAGVLHLFA